MGKLRFQNFVAFTLLCIFLLCFSPQAIAAEPSASTLAQPFSLVVVGQPTSYASMAAILGFDGSTTPLVQRRAQNFLTERGLMPKTTSGAHTSWPELAALEHWGKIGDPSALLLAGQLLARELLEPRYPGMIGTSVAIRTIYDFAFKTNRVAEIEPKFFEMIETAFQAKQELRGDGIFNTILIAPSGAQVILADVVGPKRLYEFYLRRLREKLPTYSQYAVRHLLKADRVRAMNDIASVILEGSARGQVESHRQVADELFKATIDAAESKAVAIFRFGAPVFPISEEFLDYLRWTKRLSTSLSGTPMKLTVDIARAELQKQLDRQIKSERFLQQNPDAYETSLRRMNDSFSRSAPTCESLFAPVN